MIHCRFIGPSRRDRGFSLIELLTVISIIAVLLTLGGSVLWQTRSRSTAAGATLASCIDLARSRAAARNRMVWLRIAPDRSDPANLEVRFFREEADEDPEADPVEFRRPVRLEQMMIQPELPAFADRPEVEAAETLKSGGTVIIRPSGEVHLVEEVEDFPEPPETLTALLEIGLQATRGGPDHPVKGDAVAVQIHGLSGTPTVYKP